MKDEVRRMKDEVSEAGTAVLNLVRGAVLRAEANVDLHIERDVFEPNTARAVVQEFREQLEGAGVLAAEERKEAP